MKYWFLEVVHISKLVESVAEMFSDYNWISSEISNIESNEIMVPLLHGGCKARKKTQRLCCASDIIRLRQYQIRSPLATVFVENLE